MKLLEAFKLTFIKILDKLNYFKINYKLYLSLLLLAIITVTPSILFVYFMSIEHIFIGSIMIIIQIPFFFLGLDVVFNLIMLSKEENNANI